MFKPDEEYQQRVQRAVVTAIVRVSAVDTGGGKHGAVMQPLDIAAVLTRMVAEFLAADANQEQKITKRDIRKLADEFASILAKKMTQTLESGSVVPPFTQVAPLPVDSSLN